MLSADAMIGSEREAFEVCKDTMNPGQQDMRCHGSDDLWLVFVVLQAAIRGEAIADHGCAALDDTADKSGDAFRGEVAQRFEPDPAWMAFLGQLYCTDDQKLADVASALAACDGILLRAVRDLGLIHLDKVEEGRALGIDHSPAKLLKHEPGGLVAAEAELSLELEGLAKFRLFQQYPPIPERRSLDFIRQPNVRKRVQAV